MKRPLLWASAAILACAIAAPPVCAQTATGENVLTPPLPETHHRVNPGTPETEYGEGHPYVRDFNGYLDAHPDEAAALAKNPRLIHDPNYVASHPDLQAYLKAHPRMARTYEHHPNRFMRREKRYEKSEQRWEKHHNKAENH